ncbi:short-chain dehydrogenase [Pseudomonas kunmingensis]|uniref:short-chain dehydrogenase n=1 Tax=Stutzerimonas kunmingensis TaxID=1211807 RepID=UPI0015E3C7F1|nr:short-chain dehydrogenase [Stutzerimonas kunmingensis]MBA1238217.1 short-chain dehydrogenase [Stutzerimonas kunmingensis]
MTTKKPALPALPTAKEFCLTVPLYEKFGYDNEADNGFFALEQFEETLDMHCPECGQHSVFLPRKNNYSTNSHYTNYIFSLLFRCSRNASHQALFIFRAHRGVIQKIGQIPALADLAMPDMKKYRPVLGEERFKELSRAIGLTTHGVGVGAFVYLRRIFESLIEEARVRAAKEPSWDEQAYVAGRMADRIVMLERFLPPFLVENRALYSVLSVGVHTLSEEECLAAFPAVRLAIELILDGLLEERERQTKLRSAAQSIAALKGSGGKADA